MPPDDARVPRGGGEKDGSMKNLYVGLDLGGTKLRIACSDSRGKFLHDETIRISHMAYRDGLGEWIAQSVGRAVKRFPSAEWALRSVGMGVPGTCYEGKIFLCTNIGEIRPEELKNHFSERYGASFRIMNDVKCAALGEYRTGPYGGVSDMVYVNIGTGLGMGLILDGRLYSGRHNAAGEIAYCDTGVPENGIYRKFGPDSEKTGDNRLNLEEMFSGRALGERGRLAYSDFISGGGAASGWFMEKTGGDAGRIDARLVFDGYVHGDGVMTKVLDGSLKQFSMALANICTALDPEIVVFGGGVSGDIGCVLEYIRSEIERTVPFPPAVKPAYLGSGAGVVGAVMLAMDENEAREAAKSAPPR